MNPRHLRGYYKATGFSTGAASEHLQGSARIFRELQDWSTDSTRREVVETTRTDGSTEGHK